MGASGQNHVGSQISQDDAPLHKSEETSKSEGTQAGGTLQHSSSMASTKSTSTATRTKDYNDEMVRSFKLNIHEFTLPLSIIHRCLLFFSLFIL